MSYKGKISVLNNIVDCPGRQIINWNATSENIKNHNIRGTKIFVNQSYTTTSEVLRNYNSGSLMAGNLADLKNAIVKFDSSAVIGWTQK